VTFPVVEVLTSSDEPSYAALVSSVDGTHVTHTLAYRAMLRDVLNARDTYIVAKSGGEVVGALPMFTAEGPHGNMMNSLPFYGSHGGVLLSGSVQDPEAVFMALLSCMRDLAKELDVITSTIVTGPLMPYQELFHSLTSPWFVDERIGQICQLPSVDDCVGTEEALVDTLDPKRLWDVRKARRMGVTCEESDDIEDMRFLADVQARNMERLGVPPKAWGAFESIMRHFSAGSGWRLFVARLDGLRIGALLALYHGRIAEYFVPAVVAEHRSTQAGSLMVFEAMLRASADGYRYWNLGGTALTGQEGVYRFKQRWGASDEPYNYFGIGFGDTNGLRALTPEQLLTAYPNFFVIPFRLLDSSERKDPGAVA
jgi:hypothetical protein